MALLTQDVLEACWRHTSQHGTAMELRHLRTISIAVAEEEDSLTSRCRAAAAHVAALAQSADPRSGVRWFGAEL